MLDMEKRIAFSKKVCCKIIDGEAFLLTTNDNCFYTLNPVGTRVWELADNKRTINEIANIICREFKVDRKTAVKDIAIFIGELLKKKICKLSRYKPPKSRDKD